VPLISSFDPWHSSLCTCPPKLTINPYTGCDHNCLYCYASSYIPNHREARLKKSLLSILRREVTKVNGKLLTMSSSSDPYPTIERELGLTRQCLKIISTSNCRLQIFTKSDMITRDVDLLTKMPCTVALTITTINEEIAKILEPKAPSPSKRLKAIETLTAEGIPIIVRVDPIIPFLNDDPSQLLSELAGLGVKHITSSTYKVKNDNWNRLHKALPEITEKLAPLYFKQGEKLGGSIILPEEIRHKLMKNLQELANWHGMKFGVCREGFSELNTANVMAHG
jgi:DNA repair photolyase